MNARILLLLLLIGGFAAADPAPADDAQLHTYVIERTIPGASELSEQELEAISQKSRKVLEALGPQIEWLHSYVAEDKFYCVYSAPSKDLIEMHADMGGFPADRISKVSTVLDPSAAD